MNIAFTRCLLTIAALCAGCFGLPSLALAQGTDAAGARAGTSKGPAGVAVLDKPRVVRRASPGFHSEEITLEFVDGGRTLAAGYTITAGDERNMNGRYLVLWQAATGRELCTLAPHSIAWVSRSFLPGGSLLVEAFPFGTNIIDTATCKTELHLKTDEADQVAGKPDAVQELMSFAQHGRLLTTLSSAGTFKIWSVNSGEKLLTLADQAPGSWAFAPDGSTLASSSEDGVIRLRDLATGKEVRSLPRDSGGRLRFLADGRTLAAVADRALKLWDPATGRLIQTVSGATSFEFSPDGRVLAAIADGAAKLLDAATGRERYSLSANSSWFGLSKDNLTKLSFSPGGRLLVARYEKSAKLRDAATGKELHSFFNGSVPVRDLMFSPDERLVAAVSDTSFEIWDANTGKPRFTLAGVSGVRASPDLSLFTANSPDGSVALRDGTTGRQLQQLSAGRLDAVAFSPDGRELAAFSNGGEVKLWALRKERRSP